MKTVVFDTNVLLADPGALLSFPDTNVVIPETVLGELDKLKTSRVDPDLRFRGREVSRVLFDLSEQGSLTEGVKLPDGGLLRVATDDTISAWAARVDDAWLAQDLVWFSQAAQQELRAPRGFLVAHFFNHQTHHRGQAHAMITACGEQTGDTDLFLVV